MYILVNKTKVKGFPGLIYRLVKRYVVDQTSFQGLINSSLLEISFEALYIGYICGINVLYRQANLQPVWGLQDTNVHTHCKSQT